MAYPPDPVDVRVSAPDPQDRDTAAQGRDDTIRRALNPELFYLSERDAISDAAGDALDALLAENKKLRAALERIAWRIGTDLPHARRLDRDEMQATAREALAGEDDE